MPRVKRKLSVKEIESAPIKDKSYKLYDGDGLHMLIRPSGTKVWQYAYKFRGKRTVYTIGNFLKKGVAGHISASDARRRRYEIRELIDRGINPNEQKKYISARGKKETTFEFVAREWHSKGVWVEKHAKSILRALEKDIFPYIGEKQITEITPQDIISIISNIEVRGALDVAKRNCQRCVDIFDYAISKDVCQNNPAIGRVRYIKKRKVKHRPYLNEEQMPEFLHMLNNYHGRDYVRFGMKLLVITFLRPGELRNGRWDEIDWDQRLWRISAERMKMSRDHIIPLSDQAIEILSNIYDVTGYGDLIFPSIKSPHKPISDVTLTKVLRVMGYSGDVVVPHGFRHTASTILHEYGYNSDYIEMQLAHQDKNKIRGTYNHAKYLDERRRMMQWYSDHLNKLEMNYTYAAGKSTIVR